MQYKEAVEKVTNGASWFDKAHPGWERKIDLSELDMSNGCHCIWGQNVDRVWVMADDFSAMIPIDGYFSALRFMSEGTDFLTAGRWMIDHGFALPSSNDPEDLNDFAVLDEVWTDLIKERFNSGILSDQ
jgi:hypothetical protein